MSIDWYLIHQPYMQVSGFENDDMGSGFNDSLNADIATDVEVCNYDLSFRKSVRAIVQNTVQDTKLKTLSRNVLLPIGTCKAGMYIKTDARYWLIIGIVDNNKVYEKAICIQCNYLITWAKPDGTIIQRWANAASASQYNHGESGSTYYNVRSDQMILLMPDDTDTLLLDSGTRLVIDRRCKIYEESIDDSVTRATDYPLIIYRLTRIDNVLYDYQDSGHSEFIVYQDEQQEDDGYYVVNGHGYWLCGQPNIQTEPKENIGRIDSTTSVLYDGANAVTFTAIFVDENGSEIDGDVQWDIQCDFSADINRTIDRNTISIWVDNTKVINRSFELVASMNGYTDLHKTITIRAFI